MKNAHFVSEFSSPSSGDKLLAKAINQELKNQKLKVLVSF